MFQPKALQICVWFYYECLICLIIVVKVEDTDLVFILNTKSLSRNDKYRALEKQKELASALASKDIYKINKVRIGVASRDNPTTLDNDKNRVVTQIRKLVVQDTDNLERELNEAITLLSRSLQRNRKSIVLFTIGNGYNAHPKLLERMKKDDIKLIVVDVNKSLSKPVVDPPFVGEKTVDVPVVVTVDPNVEEIAIKSLTGKFFIHYNGQK